MGSLDYNQFLDDLGEFDNYAESYLLFLKESLGGKQPGLGALILTPEQPSQEAVDTFRTPTMAHQDYTVIFIDTTSFEEGGTLTVDIHVGRDKGIGIFHLLAGDQKLPTEKVPDSIDAEAWHSQQSDEYKRALDGLSMVWGIFPGETGKLQHEFEWGCRFQLCATGDQWGGPGTINAFHAKVSVDVG